MVIGDTKGRQEISVETVDAAVLAAPAGGKCYQRVHNTSYLLSGQPPPHLNMPYVYNAATL